MFCDITWWNYSNIGGGWNKTIDTVANVGCFFVGCHVDTKEDVITGPTKAEYMDAAVIGMVNPIGMPATRLASSVTNASDDVVYAGVRKASKFLQDIGVPRQYRKQIIEAFDIPSINVRTAGNAEYGIRFYDNVEAMPKGRFVFETFPASRESLAVRSKWNQMTNFKQWRIRPGATIIEGVTAQQGPYLRGGQRQKYVNFLEDLMDVFK